MRSGRSLPLHLARETRPVLAMVTVLLTVALWGPLWFTQMESPQYHGEETLEVIIYAGHMEGDLQEIETLNKYIGVHIPENLPELNASFWVIGALLLVSLLAQLLPEAHRRKAALALFVLMLVVLIAGTGLLRHRLEEFGHDRTDSIMARVSDFSPPLFGSAKIVNFAVQAGPGYGTWAFGAALLLSGWAARSGPEKRESPIVGREEKAEDFNAELVQKS